jgi:hypothetical protein
MPDRLIRLDLGMVYVHVPRLFQKKHFLSSPPVEASGMRTSTGLYNDGLVFGTCLNNNAVSILPISVRVNYRAHASFRPHGRIIRHVMARFKFLRAESVLPGGNCLGPGRTCRRDRQPLALQPGRNNARRDDQAPYCSQCAQGVVRRPVCKRHRVRYRSADVQSVFSVLSLPTCANAGYLNLAEY